MSRCQALRGERRRSRCNYTACPQEYLLVGQLAFYAVELCLWCAYEGHATEWDLPPATQLRKILPGEVNVLGIFVGGPEVPLKDEEKVGVSPAAPPNAATSALEEALLEEPDNAALSALEQAFI